jgi:nitrogen fixation NifU-like protein
VEVISPRPGDVANGITDAALTEEQMYSELVMDHFSNPRNVGTIPDADGVGVEGNPVCGDLMKIFIKVRDEKIEDIKFQTFGCGAAIATSSMVTEMVKGKTLEEAMKVSNRAVAEALGGLPGNKMHCSNLAADALHRAIEDYRAKRNGSLAPAHQSAEAN